MTSRPAAPLLEPLFVALLGSPLPVQVQFWDGSRLGDADRQATVVVHRPEALRRILYAPDELGIARAYVAGDLDIEGDFAATLQALWTAHPGEFRLPPREWARAVAAGVALGVIGPPPSPPLEEFRPPRWHPRHSRARDQRAVTHHYDVSNDFYGLVLGPAMTYSCARFVTPDASLEDAQTSKHDLICRKLGLGPGSRLLDVGCGWGSMGIHAASAYGADVVGITLSQPQADLARKRAAQAGVTEQVDIRLQDYRDLGAERFDAISSIGMFEHVGRARSREYFDHLAAALEPGGRLLNHAISTPEGAGFDRRSFIARYVFPDGELQDIADTAAAAQASGLEVRDVECLREHYAITLRRWVDNLLAHWDEAVAAVGVTRARIWKLYMTGAAASFARGEISLHQLLVVKPHPNGDSGMPPTRAGLT